MSCRILMVVGLTCLAGSLLRPAAARAQGLTGRVIDENGVAVAGAQVTLSGAAAAAPLAAVSDDAGRFLLQDVPPGTYELRAEKPGYYATIARACRIGSPPAPLEVVLNHKQELEEKVDVVYSAPVVDREQAAAVASLTAAEVTDLPFVATHDFRNALPLISGIVKDNQGRMHLNGGAENQVYYSLDGFNIASPVTGTLVNRIAVDSIRAVRVETSRYAAEFGKGSAGVMALESSRGDDRFRFSSTNFFPSFALRNGLGISNWNPRGTVSGPIVKGRAWFYSAVDLQYDLNSVEELPRGANTNPNWLANGSNRFQLNLSNRNILTAGLLFNLRSSRHAGISPLDPEETSLNLEDRLCFLNLRDQAFFGEWLLETGLAWNRMRSSEMPQGNRVFELSPEGKSGNYYKQLQGRVSRLQAVATVITPFWNWHGRHTLKFGVDADRIVYRQFSSRGPIEIRGASGEVLRRVDFQGEPHFGRNNAEYSGYVQDSWKASGQVFVEAGLRFDLDQVLHRSLWSPRLAFSWGPARIPDSKFTAGIGVFYDATSLELLARAQDQERADFFFQSGGPVPPGLPVVTRFFADAKDLTAPLFLNWSAGWQQKLRRGFYLEANLNRRSGRNGWVYTRMPPDGSAPNGYRLESIRRDSYTEVELSLSKMIREKSPWLVSYVRSASHASHVIDFSLDNPIFATQAAGPPDWDAPNRLISWSAFPVPRFKEYTLAYFVEWRSGLPWSSVNQYQQLAGNPNSRRFPDYVCLNLHLERRVRFLHAAWALRAGFNNLTGHWNPTVVQNNLDSAQYGGFAGSQGRVFTGRIRFLGRN